MSVQFLLDTDYNTLSATERQRIIDSSTYTLSAKNASDIRLWSVQYAASISGDDAPVQVWHAPYLLPTEVFVASHSL